MIDILKPVGRPSDSVFTEKNGNSRSAAKRLSIVNEIDRASPKFIRIKYEF
jgi:hypothetical protein